MPQRSLKTLKIDDVLDRDAVLSSKPVLIGGGTDGASVNVGQHNSMRAKLQDSLQWLFWAWCYAHHLELASKNGLISNLFKEIEEMLLRLYYLYEKSSKKTHELASIVEDLKEAFDFPRSGNVPIGSRWINHKRRALQRVTDRYGAYISHLIVLSGDMSLKSEDRARLKGYVQKWTHAKFLIACAMCTQVLKPPSILSLSLQGSDVDIVFGIKQLLKASTTLASMVKQDPLQWPTVKIVLDRVKNDSGENVYQGVALRRYDATTLSYCSSEALADLKRLTEKMRERIQWSDTDLLRALLVFLETQSWMKRNVSGDEGDRDPALAELKAAIELILSQVRDPLEGTGVNVSSLQDEIEYAVGYARQYLSLESTHYRRVWYNLHICPDASSWPNLLLLCELVFSLPFSNGRVEQIFSSLKIIKTTSRTSLSVNTLDDLLEIFVEGPPLDGFSADPAVDLWWSRCYTTRRVNQGPRKPYKPRSDKSSSSTASQSDSESKGSAFGTG